ncbi:MAG: flavodoxin domain-containing protein [Oscillospiraceae bacterium]|nr:flavodoxin domain-containing protein [Oscillospiraceae bacterium]
MKDVLVVYKSRYGATERYAQWIAEALGCEALPVEKVKTATLLECRMLIFGGGLYMGRINGIAALTRRFQELKDKTLFVFTAGMTEPEDDGYYAFLYTRNFTEKMRKRIHFFAFPGAVEAQKLGRFHRWVMRMAMQDRAKKDPANAQEYLKMQMDFVDPQYIKPLVEKAQGILDDWDEKKKRQEELRQQAEGGEAEA